MKGEFRIFNDKVEGGCDANYFDNSRFNFKSMTGFKLNIRNFQYKKEILDFYIAFNDGGTKHTDEEIERVKAMRNDCGNYLMVNVTIVLYVVGNNLIKC